ncbi:histone-lysine N-methyltransferase ATX2-like [Salvia splendens]|uniref:histone-lysine N-methyltransferase ATX2-like n=1 Tax=Salvia splendens TaxID=180675 RepID=UPI001C26401D|nr:histone-lysine N-methyltransferase ATX2-like [Salvia splendens]
MAADALPGNGGAKLSDDDEFPRGGAPLKYIPLCDLYSATSPCVTASGSKKVKAAVRKPPQTNGHGQLAKHPITLESQFGIVYSRRRKRAESTNFMKGLLLDAELEADGRGEGAVVKQRRVRNVELGSDCKSSEESDDPTSLSDDLDKTDCRYVRETRNACRIVNNSHVKKRKIDSSETVVKNSGARRMKKWVRLSFEGVDPDKFIELQCKVFWPLDASWYSGHITGYNYETRRHHLKYEDGEQEDLVLSKERIKFHISLKEMQSMELKLCEKSPEADELDANEMMVLAATLDDDCQEIETGDLIWAKLTGHAVWPAIVLDESHVGKHKGLNKISGEKSVIVQFFGTYDFARVPRKQVIQFLKGLLTSCHSKCKKPTFVRGLEEAKVYLSEQRLPVKMQQLRDGVDGDVKDNRSGVNEDGADSGGESLSYDKILKKLDDLKSCKLEDGELQIVSLGKIVRDSSNFQNEKYIWPEGYTAVRKFTSLTDPTLHTMYEMEVLRDVDSRTKPLFKVKGDNGEEFNGPTPSACWNKIYKKIRIMQIRNKDCKADQKLSSGSYMFGFSHPKVSRLIKEISNSRSVAKGSQLACKKMKNSSAGYRPVTVTWKDLDKCNVCHMDEEYENNLFLQCDKCRMMVHARCYGELEPSGGVLWLCNLCRPGAPVSPLCCLCPVVGGAMKPTADDCWAHLACAIWIPETCLSDIKKMEPIDGIDRINKDRWKLICSICHVSYGACIQCSDFNCRVSFHPLCARAAGFCLEPEDMDRVHAALLDEDEEDQSIQLLSFCQRHRPKSNENMLSDKRIVQKEDEHAEYIPPINPSGCARTEIYDYRKKRAKNGQDGPSSKRLYVENVPHIPGGFSHHMPLWNKMSSSEPGGSKHSVDLLELKNLQLKSSREFLSVADKYNHMKETYRRRLAYGKSRIHGFGVFTKLPYKAGDMVIEYTGEVIRGSVADRREHLSYDKLVGAGTYIFRVDDNRVLDATKAGSIAQLINHSCESNCYSRVISANDQDHIIIFAKRDINYGEELTYDYRFSSIGERLACHCGSSRCRGTVNDIESEERLKKLHVPSSELTDWKGE